MMNFLAKEAFSRVYEPKTNVKRPVGQNIKETSFRGIWTFLKKKVSGCGQYDDTNNVHFEALTFSYYGLIQDGLDNLVEIIIGTIIKSWLPDYQSQLMAGLQ